MRVLYFTRDYTPHDHRFLSALAETEHEVFYLRLERHPRQVEDRPLPPQITQVKWAGGQEPFRWRGFPRLRRGLRRVLAQVQPDLVHAGPLQTAALLTALVSFKPLVSMSWGSDLLKDADQNAWYRWATRTALRRSAVLVGDCDTVSQKAQTFGMPPERIITFPWGVDLVGWRSRKGWQENFVLLCTRSWEAVYGVTTVAKAFVLAAQQRPDLRLVMLGGGSLAPTLRRIFQRGGVQDCVAFPGQIGQNNLPDYYRGADLYLSASLSDGSSVSLMEALACGCPVALSDIPSNREWVDEGVEGWFFPVGDEQALARTILKAAEDNTKLPSIAQAARQRAQSQADWDVNFPNLLQAYQMACELGSR